MNIRSSSLRRASAVLAACAVTTLGLLVPPSAPAGASASIPTCSAPPGSDGYDIVTGSTAGYSPGVFSLQLVLGGASCVGGAYTVTVSSADGSKLGWKTSSTQTSNGTPAVAVTTDNGSSVSVQFLGDGASTGFLLLGTTSGYTPKDVHLVVTTGPIGGPTADRAPDDGSAYSDVSCGGCGFGFH